VIANTWKIFNTAATNEYHAMLLKVMAFTAYVTGYLKAVG
jgi:hypothetical protein